jgi:hypothetical protein
MENKMATAKTPRKLPKMSNPEKSDKFAIGVSPEHYWLITGLAQGKGINRTKMLSDIIDHYIKCTFAGEKA